MSFSACTTIHTAGYNQYAKHNFSTFDKFWPNEIKLHIFMEGDFDPIDSKKLLYYDFFKEEPNLEKFLTRNKERKWVPTDRLKAYKRDWKKFCYKSFAMYRASKMVKTDYLIWLDADNTTVRDLPLSLLESYVDPNKFCTYMNRDRHAKNRLGMRHLLSSETGFIIFNLKHPYSNEFFERFIGHYLYDRIFNLYEVTDNFLLDTVLTQMEEEKKLDNIKLTDGTYEQPMRHIELGKYLEHTMGYKKWR